MENNSKIPNDIKTLLASTLSEENLENYKIETVGTSEKGDNYTGDIYFVNLISKRKNYNFVLKCGKTSEALRKDLPIKEIFDQEIHIYRNVLPSFKEFEIKRNIPDVFDSVAKCYGISTSLGREIIVLQNLKAIGYELWDRKLPLPRHYIETVLRQYGKWHAISAAMQDQEPENFKKLLSNSPNVWTVLFNAGFDRTFRSAMEVCTELCEDNIDTDILTKWKQLKDDVDYCVFNLRKPSKALNVIIHGDGWNNNFMFKSTDAGLKVAILDWQLSGFSSPVIDVSYFLYACISGEDLQDFDDLLKTYYTSFAEHLRKLGSDPDKIYTYSDLLDDWKIYARLGIITAFFIIRLISASENDIPDMEQIADRGDDIWSKLSTNITDVDYIKHRTGCLIKHAVEKDLVKPIRL